MFGPCNLFKMLYSVGNSEELYAKELKKNRSSYEHKRGEKLSCRFRT